MTTEKTLTGYPSIDKPWLKYYSEEAVNAQVPKCNIIQNIYDSNSEYPSNVAMLYFSKKSTYKTLFDEVDTASKASLFYGKSVL